MANKLLDLYLTYTFVKRLATPFSQWPAFQLGIIDEHGNVLRKKSRLGSREENEAWGYFDIMVANLKKLLAKAPGGDKRIATMAAALLLLREHWAMTGRYDNGARLERDFHQTVTLVNEDGAAVAAPANCVGSGHIAGTAPGEDPPVRRRRKPKPMQITRRQSPRGLLR